MTDAEKIQLLREHGDRLANTLDAIYGWYDRGENVLADNEWWAKEHLAQWRQLIAQIDG